MKDARRPFLAEGLVVIDDEVWAVRTPPEFLFLSAQHYFDQLEDGFSDRSRDDPYWRDLYQGVERHRELLRTRQALLEDVNLSEMLSPVLGLRFRYIDEAESYLRSLVRFAEVLLSLDRAEFIFSLTGLGVQLFIHERLQPLAASGALAAVSVLKQDELDRMTRHLWQCN